MERIRQDWRFTVGVVGGGHFFSHFYLMAFPPLFPLLGAEFGLTNAQLGVLVSVVMAAGLLQIPVGDLVDRTGAKRVLVLGIGLTGAGTMLAATATNYVVLVALAVVAGLGQPAFHPADYAMLNAVTDESTTGTAFSIHLVSGYAGFAAAPVVIGSLGLAYGWRIALVVAGGLGILYALFAAVALETHYLDQIGEAAADSGQSFREGLSEMFTPAILALFAFFCVMVGSQQAMQSFIPILGRDAFSLSTAIGNTALTGFLVGAGAGVLVGGVLSDRYAPSRVITVGLIVSTAVLWASVSGVLPALGQWGFIAAVTIVGGFSGLVTPARDRLVSEASPPGATGKTFGFVSTGLSIGAMVGPAVYGAAIDVTSAVFAFVLMGVGYLVAAAIAFSIGTKLVPARPGATAAEGD